MISKMKKEEVKEHMERALSNLGLDVREEDPTFTDLFKMKQDCDKCQLQKKNAKYGCYCWKGDRRPLRLTSFEYCPAFKECTPETQKDDAHSSVDDTFALIRKFSSSQSKI